MLIAWVQNQYNVFYKTFRKDSSLILHVILRFFIIFGTGEFMTNTQPTIKQKA